MIYNFIIILYLSYATSFFLKAKYLKDSKNLKMCDCNFDHKCSKWDGKCIDTMIFQGGGVRAVVYSGAIKRLEDDNMMINVKNLAGTSSGAQTAALLCCGYSSNELENVLRNAPWGKILRSNLFKGIYFFFKKFGYYNGLQLEKYLDELIYLKTGKRKLTFKELYDMSNIHLKIGVCSLRDHDFKYIDYETYPDMPVSKGLRASSSIPFIFTSTKWKDELFIDGGLVGNLPTTSFPYNKCLAFSLISDNEILDNQMLMMELNDKNPKNIFSFIKVGLNILYVNAQELYSPRNKYVKNIEYIEINTDNVGLLDVNMSNETIQKLINYGYESVDDFIEKSK